MVTESFLCITNTSLNSYAYNTRVTFWVKSSEIVFVTQSVRMHRHQKREVVFEWNLRDILGKISSDSHLWIVSYWHYSHQQRLHGALSYEIRHLLTYNYRYALIPFKREWQGMDEKNLFSTREVAQFLSYGLQVICSRKMRRSTISALPRRNWANCRQWLISVDGNRES